MAGGGDPAAATAAASPAPANRCSAAAEACSATVGRPAAAPRLARAETERQKDLGSYCASKENPLHGPRATISERLLLTALSHDRRSDHESRAAWWCAWSWMGKSALWNCRPTPCRCSRCVARLQRARRKPAQGALLQRHCRRRRLGGTARLPIRPCLAQALDHLRCQLGAAYLRVRPDSDGVVEMNTCLTEPAMVRQGVGTQGAAPARRTCRSARGSCNAHPRWHLCSTPTDWLHWQTPHSSCLATPHCCPGLCPAPPLSLPARLQATTAPQRSGCCCLPRAGSRAAARWAAMPRCSASTPPQQPISAPTSCLPRC